jgi:hypothetical protein
MVMQRIENIVLANSLGALGGVGARLVARFLPSVAFESEFDVTGAPGTSGASVARLLAEIGKPISEFPSRSEDGVFFALVGGGTAGLNPTIVRVSVIAKGSDSRVYVRAVAKEGLVKQSTAQGVAGRLQEALSETAT